MTLRPLRHALDRFGLPTRAYGSEGNGDGPGKSEDDVPPTGHLARRA
ncbi:hypothetical protein POF50_019670 [Streptomyces sp. SL13]|uniref:Uncharacterized protein n=1 Tax=Streptantibioticus silvisoli TaxID=2705255 RepID=A0AA90H5B4_9ACTN|nr:hypothetical protein [Streptantibioticus silvisoli]MDI5971521.1 hypothetical protein [Streptantibioticus silvisoli]